MKLSGCFYKKYLEKLTATSLPIDFVPTMDKPIVKLTKLLTKHKQDRLANSISKQE